MRAGYLSRDSKGDCKQGKNRENGCRRYCHHQQDHHHGDDQLCEIQNSKETQNSSSSSVGTSTRRGKQLRPHLGSFRLEHGLSRPRLPKLRWPKQRPLEQLLRQRRHAVRAAVTRARIERMDTAITVTVSRITITVMISYAPVARAAEDGDELGGLSVIFVIMISVLVGIVLKILKDRARVKAK
ncbi:hypothetical protein QYF36_008159 [Acer negundo]|nr:hypothetical protein QYF36_008159 [Acer negundo]